MKIIDGFVLRNIGGVYIINGEGLKQINFDKVLRVNDTAAYLWKNVEGKDFTEDTLVDLLLQEYDVDEQTARTDVHQIVEKWLEAELITP